MQHGRDGLPNLPGPPSLVGRATRQSLAFLLVARVGDEPPQSIKVSYTPPWWQLRTGR